MAFDVSSLYLQLDKDIPSADLTLDQKEEFIKLVKLLDTDGHELLYVLIRTFEKTTSDKLSDTPYGGKLTSKELKLDLDMLPVSLKWVLYKFVVLHHKKMTEDQTLVVSLKQMGISST